VINGEMIEFFTKYCDDLNKFLLNGCQLYDLNETQVLNFGEKCYLSLDSIDISHNYLEEENEDLIDEAVDEFADFLPSVRF
jgi:hypothetical protein